MESCYVNRNKLPDNHQRLQQPNNKWLQQGQMESCYININIVYILGRMNEYQRVVIDGFDRPRTKCHGTAKTHFEPSIVAISLMIGNS